MISVARRHPVRPRSAKVPPRPSRRSPNAASGRVEELLIQAPAEDPFAWSRLLKEWLAWVAAAIVLAIAFHEAYHLLGLTT
mgnify:CR=1 FL=1